MMERNIVRKQVMDVLKSAHSRITEETGMTAGGDWKFNLQGFSSGDLIEVVVMIKNYDHTAEDEAAIVITVINKN